MIPLEGANHVIDKYMSLSPPRDRLADLGPLLQPKNMDGLYETFERRISLIKGVNPEAEKTLEPFTLSVSYLLCNVFVTYPRRSVR